MTTSHPLPLPPAPLLDQARQDWQIFLHGAAGEQTAALLSPELLVAVPQVWACSRFVARSCIRHPAMLEDLFNSGDLERCYDKSRYVQQLDRALATVTDEATLMTVLRSIRRREMVRIAWRDLAGFAPLNETLADLSALAEACLDSTLTLLHAWQKQLLGAPLDAQGVEQQLVVVGMGKLGAHELNFSSDIDLIFAYEAVGETSGTAKPVANEHFFTRLGQRLARVISETTADGFVFRTDLRLRPFGSSGPLVASFAMMEHYYQTHGRDWERYAWVKGRVVAGDRQAGARLLAILRPFVYRRYLDFGAFEELREMKKLINREIQHKGMEENVKLGAGGIREVEFIGQAFQLIRGGREPALQERSILKILERLRAANYLPEHVTQSLSEAYRFLRRAENRIQQQDDHQTHQLPTDGNDRLRLAYAMDFGCWDDFLRQLNTHMEHVHQHFEQVFESPHTDHAQSDSAQMAVVWQSSGDNDGTQCQQILSDAGYDDATEALRMVRQLRRGSCYRSLPKKGTARMDHLLPLILGANAHNEQATAVLSRLIRLVEAIARRTAYLALLAENPVALSQLVSLCAASPWIAQLLTRHPILLDELLDPRTLYAPPSAKELDDELALLLKRYANDDLEQQMEALRHFKQTNVLRVAAADITAQLPVMRVSDHLTEIAQCVLRHTLQLARDHLQRKHGNPRCDESCGKNGAPFTFAIVGYGKLGGIELGYGSDLDLVFLHNCAIEGGQTDGATAINNSQLFSRLGQRIIHIMNTLTPAGMLYEIDMRLRPNGASGLLVSSLDAFEQYQKNDAWVWEHQALVRARVVAGDSRAAARFDNIRRAILSRRRNAEKLRTNVREMRERMRHELALRKTGLFDLKQGAGGIVDIEFIVQYSVLRWSCDYPQLLDYTDNMRLLETLGKTGLVDATMAEQLGEAYRTYRALSHRLALQESKGLIAEGEVATYTQAVSEAWHTVMVL